VFDTHICLFELVHYRYIHKTNTAKLKQQGLEFCSITGYATDEQGNMFDGIYS